MSGTLRVGVIPTALPIVPLLTGPFVTAHPRVRVAVHSVSAEQLVQRLGDFTLDLGLTYLQDATLKGFKIQPLYEEVYLLLTRNAASLGHTDEIPW